MVTRDDELNIEFGLHATFYEKTYKMMMHNCLNKYPMIRGEKIPCAG